MRFLFALLLLACSVRRAEFTPLVTAARAGDVARVRALLAHGADPNAPSGENGWTPLLHAVHKSQPAAAAALLAAGADPNRAGDGGMTPLMMAAGYGDRATVALLLGHGAKPAAADHNGETALDYALSGMTDLDKFTYFQCQDACASLLTRVSPAAKSGSRRWARVKRCRAA
ncbi:MAG: ankyrin repeat domain-containing protein [Acidobacteria bacterium]|nr:ankyrin repeat domain-containing protein [Acidobacteriota bacterium]MBV9475247.1 ankyrin repeat domain-containing protein [Acidobacteriota bacterium]